MQLGLNKRIDLANRQAVAALVLALTAAGAGQIAFAQDAPGLSTASQSALGTEQDNLLPPEVVPLDPSAANAAAAAQAAKSQALPAGSVPGLVDSQSNTGMVSAREFRQDAINSLYNQGTLSQQQGGVSLLNQMNQGQAPQTNNSPYASPYSDAQMANNQPAQSQTLSGAPKNKPRVQDIRRGGMTNTVSSAAALGMYGMSAYYMMRPTNLLWGLGMFGLMGTGFGTRNGFRL